MKKQMTLFLAIFCLLAAMASPVWSKSTKLVGVMNVNTASAEELQLLPGVGPAKAQEIIQARTQKPFKSKDELLDVKGIGDKLLAQWSPYLAVEGQTTLKEVETQ